jgi:hypothetical protein
MVHRLYVHDTIDTRIVDIRPVYHPFSCLWLQFYRLLYHVHTACVPSIFLFVTTIILFIVSCTYGLCTIRCLVCDYNSIVYCIMYIQPVYHPFSCLWLQFYCLLYHVHTACVPSIFLFVTTILLFIESCTYSLCTIHFLVYDYRKRMVHRLYVHDTINNRIVVTNKKTDGTQAVCTWYNKQ